MTSTAAIKSASFALKGFLEGKPTGYEFTIDSLREDFMTDPATSIKLSRGAVSGFVSKAYARKAFTRVRLVGSIRKYKLVDAALIVVTNRRSKGKAPGTHPAQPFKQMADTGPAQAPLPGLGAHTISAASAPAKPAAPRLEVPADIAKLMTRDTMLGSIREIIDAHLAAFEANRPQPSSGDLIGMLGPAKVATLLSTDILLAEIRRRATHE